MNTISILSILLLNSSFHNDSDRIITIVFNGKFNGIGYNILEITNTDSTKTYKAFKGKFFKTINKVFKINVDSVTYNDTVFNKISFYRLHKLSGQKKIFQKIPNRKSKNYNVLYIYKTKPFRSRQPFSFEWITQEEFEKRSRH